MTSVDRIAENNNDRMIAESALLRLPPEIVLHICKSTRPSTCLTAASSYSALRPVWERNEQRAQSVSYLDLFDLDCLARLSPFLNALSSDPVLHRNRLRVVAPSRIQHSLFARGCHGTPLRPSVADLVRWNVMRGIGIERRWRLGIYLYSPQVRTTVRYPFSSSPNPCLFSNTDFPLPFLDCGGKS